MFGTVLLIIGLYVAHIFLIRYLDLWTCRNWGNDPHMINMSPTPFFWFFPTVGTFFILLFGTVALYGKWREGPNGKWFFGENK